MKSSRRQTAIVMVFVFTLAALGFGVMAWEDFAFSRSCQTAAGRIETVEAKKSESSKAAGDYFLTTFSYEINGSIFRNQQKLDAPREPGPAAVFFDPANPAGSRLDRPSPAADLLIVLACAAGAVGFGAQIFSTKKGRP